MSGVIPNVSSFDSVPGSIPQYRRLQAAERLQRLVNDLPTW